MERGIERFGAAIAELEAELDWELLGRTYCEGDGGGFFDAARRAAVLDGGLWIAGEVGQLLPRGGARTSLYFGAALAELPTMLCEELVLGREVRWLNLDSPEMRELERALAAVAARLGAPRLRPSAADLGSVAERSCDHLWLVSVLTDPDQFPALHDALYERAGSELATGRGELGAERLRAEELARGLLRRAAEPCALSASDEELALLGPLAASLGLALGPELAARTTAIVGDRWTLRELRRAP